MRLISHAFLAVTACLLASEAYAQPGVSYDPPPVEFADPAAAPPRPEPVADARDDRPPPPSRRRGRVRARADVAAYLEVQQVISADLAGAGDVLTYSSVAGGVEGQIVTRSVSASGGYRYQRRIGLNDDVADEDIHSGIAQVHAELVPNVVTFDAGALATRTGGTGHAVGVTNRDQGTEVYSAYAGPSVATHVGPVAVSAGYRLGYVHVDDDSLSGAAAPVDGNFSSTIHVANASVGMAPDGPLPFGWTVSAGYVREDSGSLDNRFDRRFIRGDVVVPVGPTLAVIGGIGYSRVEVSQSDIRRAVDGTPLLDARGRFVADPSRPRLSTLDTDGIYYDAGLLWRPSPRAEFQIRAGRDDDGDTVIFGAAAVQLGRSSGLTATLYDSDTSLGQGIVNNLRALPTDFQVERNPLTGDVVGGCVFGAERGRGGCLASSLQSISQIAFRARGASVIFSSTRRQWAFGAGLSYTHRDFYLPDDPLFASMLATADEDLTGFVSVSRVLTRDITLTFSPYFSFYDNDLELGLGSSLGGFGGNGFSTGASWGFSRSFLLDRLQLIVSLGLAYSSLSRDDSLIADGLIGLRYTF